MKITVTTFVLTLMVSMFSYAQPNWTQIKANYTPGYDTTEFETPYIQPHAVGGWEDGIHMTRDGRYLYCFYTPIDMLSFAQDIDTSSTNPCPFPPIAPYWRGPAFGIDTTNLINSCPTGWIHSDVMYIDLNTHTTWQTTDINDYGYYEGAPQLVEADDGTVDAFLYTRTTSKYADIYIMRNVSYNPTDAGQRIDTVSIKSPSGAEDNPHMEHINGSTYVLFFDDTYEDNTNVEIYYSISNDSGYRWSPAQPVTSINSVGNELMPHLWFDGTDWWLYYATSDPSIVGNDWRLHIVRRKQQVANDWNSWGPAEIVISPGSISGGYGQVFGVGEPTLTEWGDISFSVIYGDTTSSDTTDVYDSDPWFLPKKGSPLSLQKHAMVNQLKIYPNSSKDIITIENQSSNFRNTTFILYNSLGQTVRQIEKISSNNIVIEKQQLQKGIYFYVIKDNSGLFSRG